MVTSLELITTIKVVILIVLAILFIIFFGKDILKWLKKRIVSSDDNEEK